MPVAENWTLHCWLGILAPLFVLLNCGAAWSCNYQDINIECPMGGSDAVYNNPGGTPITDSIALCPAPSATVTQVIWNFKALTPSCTATSSNVSCSDGTNTMVLSAPASLGLSPLQFSGKVPSSPGGVFLVTGTDAANSAIKCSRDYVINNTAGSSTGGWGDPHMTTVDGVQYDFQSAGEFTALRGDRAAGDSTAVRGEGFEIQTRQTAIATTFLPGPNSYTGLSTCVAIYGAVAARVGKHRVTYEPNISGVPDPTGMQLRVDGVLTALGPQGISLGSDGRITQSWTGEGSIDIDYSDGTQLVVTPAYWTDQQKWYLNVNVYRTTATEGIFGKLARDSWLPALPDGTSLGPKPNSIHQRYLDLYGRFADGWRVTDATSLFDYGPGQSTATFTFADWPRENPQSCSIPNQISAQPVDMGVAERSCGEVVDPNMRADCVFDVSVTGYTGFAQTYLVTQQLQPGATETTLRGGKNPSRSGERVTFAATAAQKAPGGGSAPSGAVQFVLDGAAAGGPVPLDTSGRAQWSTSSLQEGQHKILAKYAPAAGWGGFKASSSPEQNHTVIAAGIGSFAEAQSNCVVVNPNRYQCNFPAVTPSTTLRIEYVSMQCGSTGTEKFSLQEFQILTTPPGSISEVAYQIPLQNQPSLAGVVNAGSLVTIYATERTLPRALIDLTPAPSGETQCTASYSGIFR